jgi:hypothetical protein
MTSDFLVIIFAYLTAMSMAALPLVAKQVKQFPFRPFGMISDSLFASSILGGLTISRVCISLSHCFLMVSTTLGWV